MIPVSRKQQKPSVDQFINEEIHVEQIEPADPNTHILPIDDQEESLDEPIDPTYAMDYISEIMNLLYTLEKEISDSIIISYIAFIEYDHNSQWKCDSTMETHW